MDCSYKMSMLLVLLSIADFGRAQMPWDKWSWSMPQQPIEYFFRRHDEMPIKAPSFQCECPPYKECVVDYKVNVAVADFLNLRGVMKEDEAKKYNEDLQSIKEKEQKNTKADVEKHQAKRRSAGNAVPEEECCCPPRNVMMPTFITDKKFDATVKRISQMKKEFGE